jgi:hypothetical protein
MKNQLKLTTTLLFALFASPLAFAEGDHDHAHGHSHQRNDLSKIVQGPHGGQIVSSKAGFSFEVTVDKERKARITFLDKDHKAVTLAGPRITGIAGERSAPTQLTFAKGNDEDANVLISDRPLPADDHVPMILTIQTSPETKKVTERFELHLH